MKQTFSLIRPRLLTIKNRIREKNGNLRIAAFGAVGLTFWAGIFAVTYRVLSYFKSIEGLGDILAQKLLSMVLVTFFSLLVFSAILTSLSKLYLSRDLNLVHSLPVACEKIFLARWIESTVDSSWMVIIYTVPVFLSYGMIYQSGIFFFVDIVLVLLPLCIIASALSAMGVMLAVIVIPASRIKSIFVFLGLVVIIILYITFRILKPVRMVDPEAFASVLIYMKNLSTPSSPLLPSTWALDSLKSALTGQIGEAMFQNAIAWSGALFLVFTNLFLAGQFYFKGFSKTQAAMIRLFKSERNELYRLFSFFSGPARAFIIKEIKTFWRDQTQWSQIFLLAALVTIYLYNFSVLPLEKSPVKTIYLQNLFSFLNMALAAFVLTAVTARFAFPSVSTEGSAFWIVRSAPISIRTFLWIKFSIYIMPLLILTEILIVATNLLLNVSDFMMYLSAITIFFMTPGVIAMGIGLGAAYPDFTSENPAQTVTGFGGLMFMIISAAYIGVVAILQAGPVYTIFMSDMKGIPISPLQWVWITGSFVIVFILSILALILPMRFGEKRLSDSIPTGFRGSRV
jgi:ABC-2 type transport system permease protein